MQKSLNKIGLIRKFLQLIPSKQFFPFPIIVLLTLLMPAIKFAFFVYLLKHVPGTSVMKLISDNPMDNPYKRLKFPLALKELIVIIKDCKINIFFLLFSSSSEKAPEEYRLTGCWWPKSIRTGYSTK